jgi:hypothetical protein
MNWTDLISADQSGVIHVGLLFWRRAGSRTPTDMGSDRAGRVAAGRRILAIRAQESYLLE